MKRNTGFAYSEDESASRRRMDFFRRGTVAANRARDRVRVVLAPGLQRVASVASHVRNLSSNVTNPNTGLAPPSIHRGRRTDEM